MEHAAKKSDMKHGSSSQAMMKAMERAMKKMPAVHQVPERKESKGKGITSPEYNWPPRLYLETHNFPGISKWQVGDTVTLVVTGQVKSIDVHDDNGKERRSAGVELTAIADLTGGDKK